MTINWQDVITNVCVTAGGGGAFLLAAAWLIKTLLNHGLAQDAEIFRTQLRADADKEIERLKNSLQMVAVEHQVRFSKLHEKRADVIADLYKRLVDALWQGQMFVRSSEANPSPAQLGEYLKTEREVSDLFRFIEQHRIYLPDSVCTLLDKFVAQVRQHVVAAGVFGSVKNWNEQTLQQSHDAFTKAYEEFENDIPAARKALEIEFRKMLGVERDQAKPAI